MSDVGCLTCTSFLPTGECHRYPPTPVLHGQNLIFVWPSVGEDDWCNEFVAVTTPTTITLTSLNPNTAPAGSTPATVDVIGTGFDSTCTIYVGEETRATFYISATDLQYTARPDLATSGQIDAVSVRNTAGDQSNTLDFTFT